MAERFTLDNHPRITKDPEVDASQLVDWVITDNEAGGKPEYAHFGRGDYTWARRCCDALNSGEDERDTYSWVRERNTRYS